MLYNKWAILTLALSVAAVAFAAAAVQVLLAWTSDHPTLYGSAVAPPMTFFDYLGMLFVLLVADFMVVQKLRRNRTGGVNGPKLA
jgi:hypothetical protein